MSFSIPTMKPFIIKSSGGVVPRNWNNYCRWTDSVLNGWGILLNGVDAKDAGTSFSGSVAINFNQDVFNIITDYGSAGVTVTYSISRAGPGAVCKYTPNPLMGTVTIGMPDIILTAPLGCSDTIDWSVSVTFAGFTALWWGDTCCTPYGYCTNNGLTGWTSERSGLTLN